MVGLNLKRCEEQGFAGRLVTASVRFHGHEDGVDLFEGLPECLLGREAWPYVPAKKFLLCDHDSKFSRDVIAAARTLGSEPIRNAFRSPWQNGVAEGWVGSCRRDLLDHVIVLNERHLKRLMGDDIRYYHEDRTHLGLAKDTPQGRPVATASANGSRIRSFSRLGGLHHRYQAA